MGDFVGYDGDGRGFEEFQLLYAIWGNDLPIEKLKGADPRTYCAVKAADGNYYAISVFDNDKAKLIRKREHIPEDQEIPTLVKPIAEMINYEISYDYEYNLQKYTFDREKLRNKLNEILGLTKPVERTRKPRRETER